MSQLLMKIPPQPRVSYPIEIESHLLSHPDKWLPENDWQNKKLVILTDNNVKKYYGDNLFKILSQYKPLLFSFSPGEKSKNYQTKQYLEEQMIHSHCNKDTLILALGGGVVGDIAGFIAATYMRGISYIQIPTTLLAMVDSSVGGKTGINTADGKNLIGAFWQPKGVVADLNCLSTLSELHLINGLIEAIKIFLTNDVKHFKYINKYIDIILQRDIPTLKQVVQQAIKIKMKIVSKDEKENNLRMVLNFGHTIGHALETMTDYSMLHGYAVALGILVEAKISQLSGLLSDEDYHSIQSLFLKLHISGSQLKSFDIEKIIKTTARDKKTKEGNVRYVLLKKIGKVCGDTNTSVYPIPEDLVRHAFYEVSEVEYGR